MRTRYFKITRPSEYWWTPTFYKVVEGENTSSELSIFQGSIDFTEDTGDTFDERVELIIDRKMYNEKISEVSREEFDMYFIRIAEKLNKLTSA